MSTQTDDVFLENWNRENRLLLSGSKGTRIFLPAHNAQRIVEVSVVRWLTRG